MHHVKRLLLQPETFIFVLFFLVLLFFGRTSEYFLDATYLFDSTTQYAEIGLMALAMTFVIIAGQIDLSVASILALVACLAGVLNGKLGVPMGVVIVLAPLMGAALGALNGACVAWLGLPSLVVTLATMALYRGVAQILLGDHSMSVPAGYTGLDWVMVPGTPVPAPLVIVLAMAVVAGLLLHKTTFGRWVYATGTNAEAARFAGIPVARVNVLVFMLSGAMAGLGAMMMNSRLSVARYDHARGDELDVITAVVMGGASIYGGRGTILGTVFALALIMMLKTGMGVANVNAVKQLTVIGTMLILAVVLTNLTERFRK